MIQSSQKFFQTIFNVKTCCSINARGFDKNLSIPIWILTEQHLIDLEFGEIGRESERKTFSCYEQIFQKNFPKTSTRICIARMR